MPPSAAPRPAVAQCAPPAATTSRAVVDLAAVAHNGRRLAQVAGVPWMAVVKADAYGHGLGPVAPLFPGARLRSGVLTDTAWLTRLRRGAPPGAS